MFETFPAEVIQIAPGQYQVLPGPRFEPGKAVNRAQLGVKAAAFQHLFNIGG
jgi:hypothetical protein